jgi:2-polyprenyl-3-methyl-5-hydroxy-6-metoxy-1,4-benzoquinol methylase
MNNSYTEEIFCLNYELEALADLTIRSEAERWVPKFMIPSIETEHLSRYQFAVDFVKGQQVLDIACGSGYGSYLLAKDGHAAHVMACDISETSLRYGNHRYGHENVTRSYEDATKYRKEGFYDVAVSFETIEHLKEYEKFLQNIHFSLKSNGVFLVSTPIVPQTRTQCGNPYHVIEWSFYDFQELLKKYFTVESVHVQGLIPISKKVSLAGRVIRKLKKELLSINEPQTPVNYHLEKFNNQYRPEEILHGYQLLVCRKA